MMGGVTQRSFSCELCRSLCTAQLLGLVSLPFWAKEFEPAHDTQNRSCSGFDSIFVTAALRWIGVEAGGTHVPRFRKMVQLEGTSLSASVVECITPAPPGIAVLAPGVEDIA